MKTLGIQMLIAFVAAVLLGGVFAEPAEARKLALVIGNGAYANVGPDFQLPNAVNDANDVASRLQQLGFIVGDGDGPVEINDGSGRLIQAITKFGHQLAEGDVVVIYYAGHGIELDGQDYILPVDSDIKNADDARNYGIPLGRFFYSSPAHVEVIVIFDACRDNPFLRRANAKQVGGTIDVPTGAMVLFSAKSGQFAQDSDPGASADQPSRNSVFAATFLQQLLTPGLSQEQIFRNTRDAVESRTSGQQSPNEIPNLSVDVVFNTTGGPPPAVSYAAAPPPPVAQPPASNPPPPPAPANTQLAVADSDGAAPSTGTGLRSISVPEASPTAAPVSAPVSTGVTSGVSQPTQSVPPPAQPAAVISPAQSVAAPAQVAAATPVPAAAPAQVLAYNAQAVSSPGGLSVPRQAPEGGGDAAFTIASIGLGHLPARPDLGDPPAIKLPASFCSLKEKFDYHDQVYLPAQLKSRDRYDKANTYLGKLDGLRQEYAQLKTGQEVFVSNIISEFIEYKRDVTDPAFQLSNTFVALHDTIMAIPVVACK